METGPLANIPDALAKKLANPFLCMALRNRPNEIQSPTNWW